MNMFGCILQRGCKSTHSINDDNYSSDIVHTIQITLLIVSWSLKHPLELKVSTDIVAMRISSGARTGLRFDSCLVIVTSNFGSLTIPPAAN